MRVYAPNTSDAEDAVDEFYDQLQNEINRTPNSDILMVLGDLNAKVRDDNSEWENVIGKHGLGNMNDRGEKLLTFCASPVF